MNKYGIAAMAVFLGMLPWSAMGETYKCVSSDGKISYAGQASIAPNVKCEPMFIKKQPVVQQVTPTPAATPNQAETDTGGMPPKMEKPNPSSQSAPANANDAKPKKEEPDHAKIKAEKAAAEKAAADKQAEMKVNQENCELAKTNLITYQHGGRMSKVNEKGEKVYLEDAEIQQKAEQAKRDVAKWCGA